MAIVEERLLRRSHRPNKKPRTVRTGAGLEMIRMNRRDRLAYQVLMSSWVPILPSGPLL